MSTWRQVRSPSVKPCSERVNGRLQLEEVKSATSRRHIILPQVALEALKAHRLRQEEEQEFLGDAWPSTGLVFTSERGTPLEPRNLVRHFKSALAKAGLPETIRFHDLRHWCASLLIAYDVHPKAIQEILGHANITTTLNIYGHLLPKVLRSATDRMGALAPDEETDETQ